jgi:hypothetical protein
MSFGVGIIIASLALLAFIVTPVLLVWGWRRWIKQPRLATSTAILSFVSFVFATGSALLAITTTGYAQVRHFGFYDPTLMKLMRWGVYLSTIGFLLGMGGVWRKSPLRWHSLVCSAGTFAFWILAAEGE